MQPIALAEASGLVQRRVGMRMRNNDSVRRPWQAQADLPAGPPAGLRAPPPRPRAPRASQGPWQQPEYARGQRTLSEGGSCRWLPVAAARHRDACGVGCTAVLVCVPTGRVAYPKLRRRQGGHKLTVFLGMRRNVGAPCHSPECSPLSQNKVKQTHGHARRRQSVPIDARRGLICSCTAGPIPPGARGLPFAAAFPQ